MHFFQEECSLSSEISYYSSYSFLTVLENLTGPDNLILIVQEITEL